VSANIPNIQERLNTYLLFIEQVKSNYFLTEYFQMLPNINKYSQKGDKVR